MADPFTMLAIGGTVLSAAGAVQQGLAANANSKAQQQMLNSRAAQADLKANDERALSQRRAGEDRRQAQLKSSRAMAVAAAGGGATFDPSIINLMGDLAAEGEYNAGIETFEGETRARDLEFGADLDRFEGEQARSAGKSAKRAGFIKAGSTILMNGSSLASKYGGGATETIHWNDGTSGKYKPTGNVMAGGYG